MIKTVQPLVTVESIADLAALSIAKGRLVFVEDDGSFHRCVSSSPLVWGTVEAPVVFGESAALSVTTSTTFQNKITTPNSAPLHPGVYVMEVSYGWCCDSQQTDFEARITFDGGQVGQLHKQEPKDSGGGGLPTGTDQRFYASRRHIITLATDLAAGIDWGLDYRSSSAGVEASIWEASITVKRLS